MSNDFTKHPSSYRDPSGFIFEKDGIIYRQVNLSFKEHFDFFISSGCYDHLVKKKLLIAHETVDQNLTGDSNGYVTLRPEKINFISYPYEWSFDMLKDAALLTLQVVKEALSFGVILKDATPYNIQWHNGRFIFIDTLSFEKYDETQPWIAYRQFCECFLGPLLIMHYLKKDMHQIMVAYPDGIPIDIVQSLLPARSKFAMHTYLHIHLHAKVSKRQEGKAVSAGGSFTKQKLLNILSSLESLVAKTKAPPASSNWSGYYEEAAQRDNYLQKKKEIVQQWIASVDSVSKTAIDVGANEGEFSKIAAQQGFDVIATDSAADCINSFYNEIKNSKQPSIFPIVIDVSNPSPSNGVLGTERASLIERVHVDLALALALIHHLVISKNMTFDMIATFFASLCQTLIIEFVPVEDEKSQALLAQKPGFQKNYTEAKFVTAFEKKFTTITKEVAGSSGRTLYMMRRR